MPQSNGQLYPEIARPSNGTRKQGGPRKGRFSAALLAGQASIATAINNLGEIVGSSQRSDGTVASFFWENGTMHDIGRVGGDDRGRAWAINDLGEVVGLSYGGNTDLNGPGGHPYIWDVVHGMRPLAPLVRGDRADVHRVFQNYTVFSINNKGEILGLSYLPKTRSMVLLRPIVHAPD